MFQRLETALNSELRSLGHPRAALLGFAVAVLAYNVLALLQRCIEQAHQATHPALQVSLYHLALQVRGGYEGMLTALPDAPWISGNPAELRSPRICTGSPATSCRARSRPVHASPNQP